MWFRRRQSCRRASLLANDGLTLAPRIDMPYWRLSVFYFFYFASLGVLVPFWALYLKDLGYSPLDIGGLMAVLMATKVIAPNIWGWIADQTGKGMFIVRLASLLSIATFLGVFWVRGFWPLALTIMLFSFFWNASLPQIEAITFSHLKERIQRYSSIRLWGSVGFVIAVAMVGQAVEWWGTALVPWLILALYVAIWFSSLSVPEADSVPRQLCASSLFAVLRHPEVLAFFVACFMMQASHGVYYSFYSIYLEQNDYSKTLIGALWAIGVVAEVLVFIVMHRIMARFGARRVLIVSLLLAVLRWQLTGLFPDQIAIMLLAQMLHAGTFGAFHASAIHLVHHYFPGGFRCRGQALYSSLSFGAGGALGSMLSGYLWEDMGAGLTFSIASLAALLGVIAAWGWVDRQHRY
jgi:PPP family 3-phenylpropionic acid transporter